MLFPTIFYTKMDKKIAHLGQYTGKVLLFGGVYSNFQALEKLIAIAQKEGISPQNCFGTGDIVGYCAEPEETVQLYRAWGAHSIAGNVEIQLSEGAEECGCHFAEGSRCDGFSKFWYPFAQEKLSKDSVNWMRKLPHNITFAFAGKKICLVHGAFDTISEFIFKSSPDYIKRLNFEKTGADVIVGGHSGIPFHQELNGKLWLNPGVIGMPANDGTPRVWYMILKDMDGTLFFEHHGLEYDNQKTYELMLKNELPGEYANTLVSGIWDNMEILPEREKQSQGIPLNFMVDTIKK